MNFADSFVDALSRYDRACPPDNVRTSPEQVATRAAEVLAYWNRTEGYQHFAWALGELGDNDETADPLHELYLAGDTAALGEAVARMIREAQEAKAAQYAQDEADGNLMPHELLRRVP